MKYEIKVQPRSSQEKIVVQGTQLKVYIHAAPTDGQANDAVIRMIAEHFSVPKTCVEIIRGHTSRNKVIEIHG